MSSGPSYPIQIWNDRPLVVPNRFMSHSTTIQLFVPSVSVPMRTPSAEALSRSVQYGARTPFGRAAFGNGVTLQQLLSADVPPPRTRYPLESTPIRVIIWPPKL